MNRNFTRLFSEPCDAALLSMNVGQRRISIGAQDMKPVGCACDEKRAFTAEKNVDGLIIRVEGTVFPRYSAIEWVVRLENAGAGNTEEISDIRVADLRMGVTAEETVVYAGINGDSCSADNYMPFEHPLKAGDGYCLSPNKGRSSGLSFPYFDILDENGGMIAAIGWTGQWQYSVSRDEDAVCVAIGLEYARFYLKPGEAIRLPRVLFKTFDGCSTDGHNNFRALLRKYFTPKKPDSELVSLPAAIQCFDRYTFTMPHWNTEQGQIEYADYAARIGNIDTVWLDAAWFKGGFPNGVGNYIYREGFPNGLKPVADRTHEHGMKFMLWFEPERVAYDSQVYEEHLDWIIRDPNAKPWAWVPPGEDPSICRCSGILDLGRDEVVDFLVEQVSRIIEENGIDIYRQDFNIAPLLFWHLNDEPGRLGLSEIKHITGMYRFWDALLERFPGMLIDNCAGGGQRIDLETCMRSVPLWRSDTGCSPLSDDRPSDMWNQNQTLSLSRYLVFHAVASWNWDAYEFRSAATAGIACNFDVFNPDFNFEGAGACMEEFARLRKYWTGDFYPMTRATLDDTVWSAFQFHRDDLDAGVVMLFRRASSPYDSAVFSLRGVDSSATYRLTLSDENRCITTAEVSGQALLDGYRFTLPDRRTSLAVEYTRL